jgi:hypothetical protein
MPDPLRQRGDASQLGPHPRREGHRGCLPRVQFVPLNNKSLASSSGTHVSPASMVRRTGTDSPVSAERFISTDPLSNRASAETRSPPTTTITSPGTSSRASMILVTDSRRTRACWGRYAASASTAFSACRS